jgi:hypothetical protein
MVQMFHCYGLGTKIERAAREHTVQEVEFGQRKQFCKKSDASMVECM